MLHEYNFSKFLLRVLFLYFLFTQLQKENAVLNIIPVFSFSIFLAVCYIWRKGYAPFNSLNNYATKCFIGNHTLKAKKLEKFGITLKSNDTQNVKSKRT